MTTKRIAWLDMSRGLAILAVVLIHSMSPVMDGHLFMSRIYRFLYWLVNPMFMLLAGLVSGKVVTATADQRLGILKKRATQFLIPYATWAVIYLAMRAVFKDYVRFESAPLWTIILGNNPDGQLWFLYVLFLLSALALLIREKTSILWCVLTLLVSFFAPLIPSHLRFPGIGLSYSLFQMGFYFLGLCLYRHRSSFFSHGFPALACAVLGLGQLILVLLGYEFWFLKLPAAFCVCYTLFYCCGRLPGGRIANGLSYLGQHSMEVYILHAPFLLVGRAILRPLLGSLPWLYALTMTACSSAAALLISHFILKKVKILRLLLLGGSST